MLHLHNSSLLYYLHSSYLLRNYTESRQSIRRLLYRKVRYHYHACQGNTAANATYVRDVYASYSRVRLNIKFLLLLLTMPQRQPDLRKHIGIKRKRSPAVRSNLNTTTNQVRRLRHTSRSEYLTSSVAILKLIGSFLGVRHCLSFTLNPVTLSPPGPSMLNCILDWLPCFSLPWYTGRQLIGAPSHS